MINATRAHTAVRVTAAMITCMLFCAGCLPSSATGLQEDDIHFYQLDPVEPGQEVAVIETTAGTIQIVLFPEQAPNTVAYFRELVEQGFYDGTEWIRDDANHSMLAGSLDEYGSLGEGDGIPCEITPNLWHFSGAVSVLGYERSRLYPEMLSDSRFFIIGEVAATTDMVRQMEEYKYPQKVIDAYKEYGGLPQYTGSYTVFGQVVSGMDVVEAMVSDTDGEAPQIQRIYFAAYQENPEIESTGLKTGA